METPKHPLLIYISHFQMGDYIAFAWLVLLFFLLLFLAILLAKKRPILAIVIVLLDLALLFGGPFVIKYYLDRSLRSHNTSLDHVQQLVFSETLIVQGTLTNTASIPFAWCGVNIRVIPKKEGKMVDVLKSLKPFYRTSIFLETPLASGEAIAFEKLIDGFRMDETMEVILRTECY